jgi:hypothetical protein
LKQELADDPNVLLVQSTRLGVLLYVCYGCNKLSSSGYMVAGQKHIAKELNRAQSTINEAINYLHEKKLLVAEPVDTRHASAGTVLSIMRGSYLRKALFDSGRTPYLSIPDTVVKDLKKYVGDPLDLIVGLTKEAYTRGLEFELSTKLMLMCSGISTHEQLYKAIAVVQGLFCIEPVDAKRAAYTVSLLHPETHEPLQAAKDTAEEKLADSKAKNKLFKPNSDVRAFELKLLVQELLETKTEIKGEEAMKCPRCKETLTINTRKHHFGLVHCHGKCSINQTCKTGDHLLAEAKGLSLENARRILEGKPIAPPAGMEVAI